MRRPICLLSTKKAISIFFLLIPLLNCWKKQSHDIDAPEFPTYKLTIKIVDIDTSAPMQKAVFRGVLMAAVFGESYEFQDSTNYKSDLAFAVYPGAYQISCIVRGVQVLEDRFFMGFEDSTLIIKVPKVVFASERERVPLQVGLWKYGICWKDAGTFATLGEWLPYPESKATYTRLYEGNSPEELSVIGSKVFETENPPLSGLVWVTPNYLSFSGGLSTPEICILDRRTGQVVGQFPAPHRLVDLTYDGEFIWATSTNYRIFKFTRASTQPAAEYVSPGLHPTAIAYDGKNIWSFDEGTNWLYRHDTAMQVSKTRCLAFLNDSGYPSRATLIQHMAFDFQGKLHVPYHDNILVYSPPID